MLRSGIFVSARQEPEMDERFACATAAADSIVNGPQKPPSLNPIPERKPRGRTCLPGRTGSPES